MDLVDENDDPKSWTPDRLRDHRCLTLASDVTLLKCMQALSQKITLSANNLLKDLDSLGEDTTSASVEVECCIQNLNLISTKQFMEKRVYDEEVTEKKEGLVDQVQPSAPVDFVPKIKEAIKIGLPAVKLQVVNLDGDDTISTHNSTRKNYSLRCLPYLLGTEEFIDSYTVGIAEQIRTQNKPELTSTFLQSNYTNQPKSSNNSESSVQSSPSLQSHSRSLLPAIEKVHSDSEISSLSETLSGLPVETKEHTENLPRSSYNVLQDELAARFQGSNTINTKAATSVASSNTSESQHRPIDTSSVYGAIGATLSRSETVRPLESDQQQKTRNLFDDSSSESDDGLFGTNAPKVSVPSVVNPVTYNRSNSSTALKPQVEVKKVNNFVAPIKKTSSNLFGSSDSEDDLFGGVDFNVSKTVSKPSIMPNTISSSNENNFIKSNEKANDNIRTENQETPKIPNEIRIESNSLFNDEPDFAITKSNANSLAAEVPKSNPSDIINHSKQKENKDHVQSKPKGLFADSDSDEDLFRSILTKPKEVAAQPPKQISPVTTGLVSDSNRFQSTPIQNCDKKEDLTRKRPASQNNNIPTQDERNPQPKLKASRLFDDDSDDEDLFSGISTYKPVVSQPKIPATQTEEIEDEDLFSDVLVSKPILGTVHSVGNAEGFANSDVKVSPIPSSKLDSVTGAPDLGKGDLFDQTAKKQTNSAPSTEKEAKSNNNSSNSDTPSIKPDSESTDSLKSQPQTVSDFKGVFNGLPTKPVPPQKVSKLTAFEDSDDDDDLFGVSEANKRPSQTPTAVDAKKEVTTPKDLFTVGSHQEKQVISSDSKGTLETSGKTETSNGELHDSPEQEAEIKPQIGDQSTSHIAALKLSLAMQPSGLSFSAPQSLESSSSNSVRKPVGGVPLFGPRIPSPVKSHPEAKSNVVSPDPTVEPKDSLTSNSDILDCLGRQRPKGPSRRQPTREFRRSKIQDDDSSAVENEEACQVPNGESTSNSSPITSHAEHSSTPIEATPPKPVERSLFDDSDSSDSELFKVSVPKITSNTQVSQKKGGLNYNAKINSSLLGSGSDDSIFSSQAAVPTPKRVTAPPFLADSDDDDDLFASTNKVRESSKPETTVAVGDKKVTTPATDPLQGFLD